MLSIPRTGFFTPRPDYQPPLSPTLGSAQHAQAVQILMPLKSHKAQCWFGLVSCLELYIQVTRLIRQDKTRLSEPRQAWIFLQSTRRRSVVRAGRTPRGHSAATYFVALADRGRGDTRLRSLGPRTRESRPRARVEPAAERNLSCLVGAK